MSESETKNISRRSLLEWLGKGCALTLGAAALASCQSSEPAPAKDAALGWDGHRSPCRGVLGKSWL